MSFLFIICIINLFYVAFVHISVLKKQVHKDGQGIFHLTNSKSPRRLFCGGFCLTGNNLSSQAASSPVLSTRGSLTAVFGMGTGGASQPSSPDLNGLFVFPPRQACVSLARHTSVCLRGARWHFLAASTKILVHAFRSFQTLKTLQKKLLTKN